MAPGTKKVMFSPVHAQAIQEGFREHGWDPYEKDGKSINAIIKGNNKIFEILCLLFSVADGGTKPNNNTIYSNYKSQASEYILFQATQGISSPFARDDNDAGNKCKDDCFCL